MHPYLRKNRKYPRKNNPYSRKNSPYPSIFSDRERGPAESIGKRGNKECNKYGGSYFFNGPNLVILSTKQKSTEMAQKFEQTQTQTQTQQLSTLQVALAGLVQLPVAQLAERVRNELVDNAALEESYDDPDEHFDGAGPDDDRSGDSSGDEAAGPDDEWSGADGSIRDSLSDYANADEVPDYLQQRADDARERREIPLTGGTSSFDDLTSQIGEHDLDAHEAEIMEYLIGSLDEDGFLRKDLASLADELAIYHNIDTDEQELEHLLHVLQTFDPPGIGARSLKECLKIQLLNPELRSPYKKMALDIIDQCFKEFTSNRWDLIKDKLGLQDDDIAPLQQLLKHLNPRPGAQLGSGAESVAQSVIPDFYVSIGKDGLPEVELNQGDVPELRVSPAFRDSIKQYAADRRKLSREQHDAYVYAKQKVEAAQTFIGLIARRRQTLMAVMRVIVDLQAAFFIEDDEEALLRPMTLKDVAIRANVDISTVSRVAGSKYVQTAYGIYPLKYFFSSQFTSGDGDEMSSREIRAAIKELVAEEDPKRPYSDEALTALLAQKGLKVARRTVAKYREQLGILSTRLRRQRT